MKKDSTSAVSRDFRLYIEGVFVPFTRGNVSSSIGSSAIAQVSIPATDLSMSFEPRSAVHIFYSDPDDLYEDSEIPSRRGTPKYKMLFEGELLGVGFSKTPTSRSVNLTCVDITNNFDYAQKFVIGKSSAIVNATMLRAYTGADGKVDLQPTIPVTKHIVDLVTREANIIDGVRSLIRGVFTGDGSTVGTNAFLQSVQSRFKISDKVHSVADEEVLKMVSIKHIKPLLDRLLEERSPVFSLTEMINLFLSFAKYNKVSILAPKYDAGTFKSILLTPNTYFTPPPKCNVLFPDFFSNIGYDEHFMKAPTRLFLQTQPTPSGDPQGVSTSIGTTYIAPSSIKDLFPTGGGDQIPTDEFYKALTKEEEIKGIIPIIASSGYAEFVSSLSAEDSAVPGGAVTGTSRNYLLNLADYEFEMRRASGRTVQNLVGGFNDNPVVGLPVVAIDSSFMFYGILASISHSFSCEDGGSAMTSYALDLPRFVQRAQSSLGTLTDRATAALDQLAKLLDADLKAPPESVPATLNISEYLRVIKDGGASYNLVRMIEDIAGKAIDDRKFSIIAFFGFYDKGIYERLPPVPRWINAKFLNEQSGDTYQELYGCRSSIDNVNLESGRFETISEAINDAADDHAAADDPLQYAQKYTRRSGIVTQTNFETHYGLPALDSEFGYGAYPAMGPFTAPRQAAVKAYVKDLTENFAHLG